MARDEQNDHEDQPNQGTDTQFKTHHSKDSDGQSSGCSFASSPAESLRMDSDEESCRMDGAQDDGVDCAESESEIEDANDAGKRPSGPPPGWSMPPGPRPPNWPPLNAGLLSCHRVAEAEKAMNRERSSIVPAALRCPQPKDALQWRIFPLARQALAQEMLASGDGPEDASLDVVELTRFVSGNLPRVCLMHTGAAKLRGLTSLILARSVRRGRLIQKKRRYCLSCSLDAATLPVPQIAGMRLEAVWVAWETDRKRRPKQVAFRYRPESASQACGEPDSWMCARLGASQNQLAAVPDGGNASVHIVEAIHCDDIEVNLSTDSRGNVNRADWKRRGSSTAWAFVSPSQHFSAELAIEVACCCRGSVSSARSDDALQV